MRLVLGDGAGRQVEHPPEGVPDAVRHGEVGGRSIPDGHDVLLKSNAHDGAANLLADHELLAEHGQDDVLPASVGDALAQADDPLAAVAIRLVLPHGFDAFLEEVKVGVAVEVAGTREVAVKRPKLLARRESADAAQTRVKVVGQIGISVSVSGLVRARLPTEPQTVSRLKSMLARRNFDARIQIFCGSGIGIVFRFAVVAQ